MTLGPEESWRPLAAREFDPAAARHLLRRAAWTARPAEVGQAVRDGLPATLERLFGGAPWDEPEAVAAFRDELPERRRQAARATPEERRRLQHDEFERGQEVLREMSLDWLAYASRPENAAYAKWVLFLSNVYVVGSDKVRNPAFLHRHFQILADGGLGPAPALAKEVLRSPAMAIYLDLAENRRGAPNENFARELFELFLLGEGNYTETDIKQAARAFTGYRVQPLREAVAFVPRQHDGGDKTIFGETGPFDGDDVVDLAYRQPAARAHLPRRLAAGYLADEPLPAAHLQALGDAWAGSGFDLGFLVRTFFGSRLFFAPEFRGAFIKSPVQFYLGLTQDLSLKPAPLPRYVLNPLRQMGQSLFGPPNVRGWVGGRSWIDSSALGARRALVERLFRPIEPEALNADEQRALAAAAASDPGNAFFVAPPWFSPWSGLAPERAVARIEAEYLAAPPAPAFRRSLESFLAAGHPEPERLRRGLITVFESAEYQLC